MRALTPQIKPYDFAFKLVVAATILAVGGFFIVSSSLWLNAIGTLLLGAVYAHAVELQHQCLHNTAFKSRSLNRAVGVVLGTPLLSSFHAYRRSHLDHHRTLGSPSDKPFFTYRFIENPTLLAFLHDFFGIAHLRGVATSIIGQSPSKLRSSSADLIEDVAGERFDYGLMAFLLGLTYLLAIHTGSLFLFKAWIVPMLLVGLPIHFLIELPEHIGCSTTTPDVFRNTRTIRGSRFSTWFTNGNNFHVEHHLEPALSMDQMRDLFGLNQGKHRHLCSTYFEFYKLVFQIARDTRARLKTDSFARRPA